MPKVKTLPNGTYLLRGRNATYKKSTEEGKSNTVMFVYEPREAMNDVDVDLLAELGDDYDITENRIFPRIWIETGRDLDTVRNHLVKHGIDTSEGTIGDSLKAFKGTEVMAYLEQRGYTNAAGDHVIDNDAKSFAAVE